MKLGARQTTGRRNQTPTNLVRSVRHSLLPISRRTRMEENSAKEFGKLVDAYVATKKGKNGKIFGFLRFIRVKDVLEMERNLNKMSIDNKVIKANIAKYGRDGKKVESFNQPRAPADSFRTAQQIPKQRYTFGKSFADVVGVRPNPLPILPEPPINPRFLTLSHNEVARKYVTSCKGILIGEAKSLQILDNLLDLFKADGIEDCKVQYLGGLNFIIAFNISIMAKKFLSEHEGSWKKWFSWLQDYQFTHNQTSRTAWVSILGIPPHLWTEDILAKVLNKFGRVLTSITCNDDDPDVSNFKTCILLNSRKKLDDHLIIGWREKNYSVWIMELSESWAPRFTLVDNFSDCSDHEIDDDYNSSAAYDENMDVEVLENANLPLEYAPEQPPEFVAPVAPPAAVDGGLEEGQLAEEDGTSILGNQENDTASNNIVADTQFGNNCAANETVIELAAQITRPNERTLNEEINANLVGHLVHTVKTTGLSNPSKENIFLLGQVHSANCGRGLQPTYLIFQAEGLGPVKAKHKKNRIPDLNTAPSRTSSETLESGSWSESNDVRRTARRQNPKLLSDAFWEKCRVDRNNTLISIRASSGSQNRQAALSSESADPAESQISAAQNINNEVQNTINLGKDIGFQLEGFEKEVRAQIETPQELENIIQ